MPETMADDLDECLLRLLPIRIHVDTSMSSRRADASPGQDQGVLTLECRLPLEVVEPGAVGRRIEAHE